MLLRYFHRGFHYSQDGPGNRLVYHLQGCNMHCPWCSNPEGMTIGTAPQEKDVQEAAREILSCAPMFFDGGGVTFTGGEASLQLDAVYEVMKLVKAAGISTAIETNASHPGLSKLLEVCDHWMADFKHPDGEKLKAVTGVGLEHITKNFLTLAKKTTLHIRIPLIHNFNDDPDALVGFAAFFSSLEQAGGSFDIELLPYHEYGKEKWDKCGRPYTVKDGFVSNDTVNTFRETLKNRGFTLIHT